MPIFIRKENCRFPEDSYLVFTTPKRRWVAKSLDLKYLDVQKSRFEISESSSSSFHIDSILMELKENERFINNVKWFTVSKKNENEYVVESEYKSSPTISFFKYFLSIFPILGCFFLFEKNNQLKRVIDNLWEARNDLSEAYKYFKYEQLINQIGSSFSVETIKQCLNLLSSEGEIDIVKKLKSNYGSWESIEKKITEEYEILKRDMYKLGKENFEEALSIIDKHGKLKNLQDKLQEHEQELEKCRRDLREIGSGEDIENILRLKKSFGSYEVISSMIDKYKGYEQKIFSLGHQTGLDDVIDLKNDYGSFDIIRKNLDEFFELKNNYGNLKDYCENSRKQNSELNQLKNLKCKEFYDAYKERIDQLGEDNLMDASILYKKHGNLKNLEIDLFGARQKIEELERKIHELEERISGLGSNQGLEDALYLKNNYGNFDVIKQKIIKWEEIEQQKLLLEADNKNLKDKEERWASLTEETLEQLEQKKKRKDTLNPSKEGYTMEERIEDMLLKISSPDYSTDDSFHFEKQYKAPHETKRLDFWVQLKNRNRNVFSIAIECKWSDVFDQPFREFQDETDSREKKQVFAWLEQLCKYCNNCKSQLGILVTNSNVYGLKNIGIKLMKSQELPQEYHKTPILLVHESFLSPLIYIVKLVNANYVPNSEFSIFETSESFADKRLSKLLKDFEHFKINSQKLVNSWVKKAETVQKSASNIIKTTKKFEDEYLHPLIEAIQRYLDEKEFFAPEDEEEGQQQLLEGSSIVPFVEEDED